MNATIRLLMSMLVMHIIFCSASQAADFGSLWRHLADYLGGQQVVASTALSPEEQYVEQLKGSLELLKTLLIGQKEPVVIEGGETFQAVDKPNYVMLGDEIQAKEGLLLSALPSYTNDDLLKLKLELEHISNEVMGLRQGIETIFYRIQNKKGELYDNREKLFSDLVRTGIAWNGAYEALGFKKENRKQLTHEVINKKVMDLAYLSRTGELAKEAQQVRQAGYTLGSFWGKQLYDAFLDGPEAVEMLAIDPETFKGMQDAGFDHQAISKLFTTYKDSLQKVIKAIESIIERRGQAAA